MIVAKIELGKVTMQVLFLAMLIHAAHSLLEHAKETFRIVRVSIAAPVFVFGMIHGLMGRKLTANVVIDRRLIRH